MKTFQYSKKKHSKDVSVHISTSCCSSDVSCAHVDNTLVGKWSNSIRNKSDYSSLEIQAELKREKENMNAIDL